jgi:hypothetical protein
MRRAGGGGRGASGHVKRSSAGARRLKLSNSKMREWYVHFNKNSHSTTSQPSHLETEEVRPERMAAARGALLIVVTAIHPDARVKRAGIHAPVRYVL